MTTTTDHAPEAPVGIILAAGLGTRLRPLTDLLPKALCPVANRPLVDWALDAVRPHNGRVAVNVHSGRDLMLAHLEGRDIHASVEEGTALGTAGAIGRLRDWVAGRDVLVANADAWRTGSLDRLVDGWDRERARLLCVDDAARGDFGRYRYAGACLLPWRLVRELADEPSGLYEVMWREEEAAGRLDLVVSADEFVDCGTPADYLRANLLANGGRSVVGAGATVDGELVRSVVWAGARVHRHERLVDAVRATAGVTVQT